MEDIMGELIVKDDRELRRVENAIASFQSRPVCDQMRMQSLLMALPDQASQAATSSQVLW
jgi:hypothetical protein